MKLIFAIINCDDVAQVMDALSRAGFSSTRLSTSGGFLRVGNSTIMVAVDADRVQAVIDVIRAQSHSRRQLLPTPEGAGVDGCDNPPVEITVGGATLFVVDIERFEQA